MKNYNYEVKTTGEVITFAGNYRSSRGQAAAITFYMFVGMLCCGLVFSIAAPGGNLWYLLTLLTPVAPWYYYQNADRCVASADSDVHLQNRSLPVSETHTYNLIRMNAKLTLAVLIPQHHVVSLALLG